MCLVFLSSCLRLWMRLMVSLVFSVFVKAVVVNFLSLWLVIIVGCLLSCWVVFVSVSE